MFASIHTVKVLLFSLSAIFLLLTSRFIDPDGQQFDLRFEHGREKATQSKNSQFEKAKYYISKEGRPQLSLIADYIDMDQIRSEANFQKISGTINLNNGQIVTYLSDRGELAPGGKILSLSNSVVVTWKNFRISADRLDYHLVEKMLTASGGIKNSHIHHLGGDQIELTAEKAFFWPEKKKARYSGKVTGFIKRKRVYQQGLNLGADDIEFSTLSNKLSARGNLWLTKKGLKINGRRGEIIWAKPNNKLKYFVIYDDVRIVEKVQLHQRSFERKAFCEKLEGLVDEGKIILTGYPKVFQLNDVVKGNRVILREDNEVIEVDDVNVHFKVNR